MVVMRWVDRLIGIVSTLLLARILLPYDFGIVAMASVVVGFIDVIFDLGVNVAIIQRKSPDQSFYNTAWTLRIMQAFAVALLLIALAPFASDYYHDQRVTGAIQMMAVSLLIASFENIGIVNFQKDLNFIADARFVLLKRLTSFFFTIALTLALESYWGMIIGALCGRLFGTILSFSVHPMRPRFSLQDFRAIFTVSQWIFVKNISQYLDRNLHIIFVGGVSKTAVTGGYTLANEISDVPGTDLLAPINRVLFPAFARVKDDRKKLTELLLLSQSIQVMVTFPACVGFVMTANEFVRLALGQKWMFIVPFIQVLALSNIIYSICSSSNYVLTVIGQIRVLALTSWAQIIIFIAGIWLFRESLDALVIAEIRFVAIFLTFGVSYYILNKYIPTVSISAMFKGLIRPTLGCIAIVGILRFIDQLEYISVPFLLVFKITAGILIYSSVVLILWIILGRPEGAERYFINRFGRTRSNY